MALAIGMPILVSILVALVPATAAAAPSDRAHGHYPAAILEAAEQIRAEVEREGLGFQVGANPAMQYTLDELCGRKAELVPAAFAERDHRGGRPPVNPPSDLPASFLGWSSAVRDQGNCGSCWAFGTIGALEGTYLYSVQGAQAITINANGTFNVSASGPNLSEQQVVSCNPWGWGCGGGSVAFDMLTGRSGAGNYPGAATEDCFGYVARDAVCQLCSSPSYTPVTDWGYLTNDYTVPAATAIKTAIKAHGCVTAYVYVDRTFQAYTGGVYRNTKKYRYTNHQIVLCGWDDAKQAWLLKNSWGTGWGIGGFMWIAYTASRVGEGAAWCTTSLPVAH